MSTLLPMKTFRPLSSLTRITVQQDLKRAGPLQRRTQSTYPAFAEGTDGKANINAEQTSSKEPPPPCLERLSTTSLLRNLILGAFFTSPKLYRPGFSILQKIATSHSPFLNPDKNPILRAIIKPLIYDQFCAGRNRKEISETKATIRHIGYSGIILCYGREIVLSESNEQQTKSSAEADGTADIEQWKKGNLETLDMISDGDWLGIKFTGAGPKVTEALKRQEAPSSSFVDAMDALCQRANSKGIRIWVDAEQQILQDGIDMWAVFFMRKHNKEGKALVYNTIQSYLKASRTNLKQQIATAARENWTMAVKLVRGAYIGSDPRERIHDTKKDTDESYDGIARDLLSGSGLGQSESQPVQLFLAGHNPNSVAVAMDRIQSLHEQGKLKVIPDFGQLQGMADQIGCRVLQRCEQLEKEKEAGHSNVVVVPRIYKCLTWGSVQECFQYLVRRMVENSGGSDRMRDGLAAYRAELRRRLTGRAPVEV